jgi:AcrR family transcriptional regulator
MRLAAQFRPDTEVGVTAGSSPSRAATVTAGRPGADRALPSPDQALCPAGHSRPQTEPLLPQAEPCLSSAESCLPSAESCLPSAESCLPSAARGLRADATRNRVAILTAARQVFAEQGLRAPLEEIARRAGVGIATLYRRFPTRERLVAAALIEKITQFEKAASQALAEPDPWDGFAGLVRRICELQADDRGLSDLLSMTLPASEEVEQLRAKAHGHVAELVARAKASGRLRPDFAAEDLLLVLIANSAVARVTGPDGPDAWQRFVGLMLDAFQYAGGAGLPPAPTTGQMTQAMARLAADRGCGAAPAKIL